MQKILIITSMLAIVAGIVMVGLGAWGIGFTYKNVSQEKITTPSDASVPGVPVIGPLTLKSQADIIREHTLRITGDKVYAEMPRQVPQLDKDGTTVLGEDGNPVMVLNTLRDTWITATVLTTALNLGIITYAFSGLIFFLGLISIWTGITFYLLSKRAW